MILIRLLGKQYIINWMAWSDFIYFIYFSSQDLGERKVLDVQAEINKMMQNIKKLITHL